MYTLKPYKHCRAATRYTPAAVFVRTVDVAKPFDERIYSSRQSNQHIESRINAFSALDFSQGRHIDLTLAVPLRRSVEIL